MERYRQEGVVGLVGWPASRQLVLRIPDEGVAVDGHDAGDDAVRLMNGLGFRLVVALTRAGFGGAHLRTGRVSWQGKRTLFEVRRWCLRVRG